MTLRHPVSGLIDNRCEGDGIFLRIRIVHIIECVAVCCRVLQFVAGCCSVLQGVAVCCRVLQCVAGCCSRYTVLDRVDTSF